MPSAQAHWAKWLQQGWSLKGSTQVCCQGFSTFLFASFLICSPFRLLCLFMCVFIQVCLIGSPFSLHFLLPLPPVLPPRSSSSPASPPFLSLLTEVDFHVVQLRYCCLGLYSLLTVVERKAKTSIHFSTAGPGQGWGFGYRVVSTTENILFMSGNSYCSQYFSIIFNLLGMIILLLLKPQ